MPWRIELLGWLRAEQGAHAVTRFATRKSAALLACLALWPRRAHAREELIDRLWPEADLDAGRQNLRQALASLRRQLEPPGTPGGSVLIADRAYVRLNPAAVSTDVADFEAALRAGRVTEALALYKGELLPGFYEDWIQEERERLQGRADEAAQQAQSLLPAVSVPAPGLLPAALSVPADTPSVRLPLQFTQFFGREPELTQLNALLARHRLVTLTGPGGAGKTRLAIEAARRQSDYARVAFVALADVADGARLADAVADALHLPRADLRPALDRVAEALNAASPALLVWDNVEHLTAYAGPLALSLLSRVPTLRLLTTSRRRLHSAGEREYPVSALPVPSEGGTPEQIVATVAVQLFVDRAQAVRPDFQVTPRNAADIASLCRRLEGSPLALELAAARVSGLAPAQMLENLTRRFELLATRKTDKDARHRSLWAAIAWSVDLLPVPLRRFWAQLSVFRGGFTPEAAYAVTGEEAALEALTQLRERSLISAEENGSVMRFRLLDSLREFGEGQLSSEEQAALAGLHTEYYRALAKEAEPHLRGPAQAAWLEQLECEHDNLRAALARSKDELPPEADAASDPGLCFASCLWWFWWMRGHLCEGIAHIQQQAARTARAAPSSYRAKSLSGAGVMAAQRGDMDAARAFHEESVTLWRTLNETRGLGAALHNLGMYFHDLGDHAAARQAYEEAVACMERCGDRLNRPSALNNLGVLAEDAGDLVRARSFYEQSVALLREDADVGLLGNPLNNLGLIARELGDYAAAHDYLTEALTLRHSAGNITALPASVEAFAYLAAAQSQANHAQAVRACRLLGAAEAQRERAQMPLAPNDHAEHDRYAKVARAALSETAGWNAWSAGRALSWDAALAEALGN